MQTTDTPPGDFMPPPPPPPPAAASRKGLWIGLGAGALLIIVCCVGVVGVLLLQGKIPGIPSPLATAVPPGLLYSNSTSGISARYPTDWLYADQSGVVVFASSKAILDNIEDEPTNGAALAIVHPFMRISDLPASVDTSNPILVLEYVTSQELSSGLTIIENPTSRRIGSSPAASAAYHTQTSSGSLEVMLITVILKTPNVVLVIGICPNSQWAQYRPQLESITGSIQFLP